MMLATLVNALLFLADNDRDHMDWGDGWWIVMAIGMVLFWGLVVLGIAWLVSELAPWSGGRRSRSDAMAILERRFASGEISAEEYRERRTVLGSEPAKPPGGG